MTRTTKKAFFEGKSFHVVEEVYEPAEDTYLLAEKLTTGPEETVLDVGTGCGILAVIASFKARRVVAVDVNPFAVRCARMNVRVNRVSEKMDIICGDLFGPLREDELFDLILFNAPYLPTEEDEPTGWVDRAWSGGRSGRELIDRFTKEALRYLKPGGRILLVQSTLSDTERTLKELGKQGLSTKILEEHKAEFEIITLIEAIKLRKQNQAKDF